MSGDRRELLSSYQKGDNNKRIFLTLMMIKGKKKKVNEWDRILWASILWFYTHLPIWYQKFNSFNFPHQQHMLMLSFKIFLQHRDLWVTRHATLLFFFFTAFICKLLNLNVSHWTHVIIHQKLIFIMQEKKSKIICII